jgi:AraC-like DNA-binding protein
LNTITLEGLASKVGFSSYNSFFTSFKKQTKLAPKEYLLNKSKIAVQQDINVVLS